jgi:hypothetical protein
MEKSLDTYFKLARQAELPVGLASVEQMVAGFSTVPAAYGIKALFTKHRFLMNSLAGILVVGTVSLLTWLYQPFHSPEQRALPPVHNDSAATVRNVPYVSPDTLVKQAETKQNRKANPGQAPSLQPAVTADTATAATPADGLPAMDQERDHPAGATTTAATGPVIADPACGKPQSQVHCAKTKPMNPADHIENVSKFIYNQGLWAMVCSEGLCGMIDRDGGIVVPVIYDQIDKKFKYNEKQWCKVSRNDLYGFIDQDGKEVVPAIYDDITDFTENDGQWARAHRQGNLYFLDRSGKEVVIKAK